MPMRTKTRVVNVLLTNIPIAIAISLLASYLGLSSAGLPQEIFWGVYWKTVGINILLSYAVSTVVGLLLPVPKWGVAFAGLFDVKPQDGIKFGLLMTLVVNFVYVLVNDLVLTYVNAIAMNGAPMQAYLPAVLGSFLPCYVLGFAVSFIWAPEAEKLARQICNDPAPEMH